MSDEITEALIRSILTGWGAPSNPEQAAKVGGVEVDAERPVVSRTGAGWLICGSFMGHDHAGCREDGISLAHDLVRIAAPVRPLAESEMRRIIDLVEPPHVDEEIPPSEGDPFYAGDPDLEEVRTAYAESHADAEPDEVGLGEPAPDDAGDSGLDGGDAGGDYLAEEAADSPPDDIAAGDAADDIEIVAGSGGVLIRELGDALTTAKAIALMAVDDERFQRVGDYDKTANQARLDELRAIQQAIREGVHPAFTDEQTEELQALETFLPFIQRIDDYAQGLRDAIREAGDLEVLTSIDIISGWPE